MKVVKLAAAARLNVFDVEFAGIALIAERWHLCNNTTAFRSYLY
jgi:hypothetical protein